MKRNIILIGMPGAGKSTLGVLIAKILGMDYLDTDIFIQKREGKLLQEIIDEKGSEYFAQAEENALLAIDCENTVIATGGSAVYSEAGMTKLRENGTVVYLSITPETMVSRIHNLETRGILFKPGETLLDMFAYRVPFYERYCDITVDCNGNEMVESAEAIIKYVSGLNLEVSELNS